MRTLLALALAAILLHPNRAVAETIGGIDATGPQSLASKLESLYLLVIGRGSVPVVQYVVKPNDTVEKILRDKSSFKGAFFPKVLDSLACDLNPIVCHRELRPAEGNGRGLVGIVNPLELAITQGDWSGLKADQTIILPDLTIDLDLVGGSYEKSAGEPIERVIERNNACHDTGVSIEECSKLTAYMNYNIKEYASEKYSGEISVPRAEYTVSIPSDCSTLCAILNKPILVDVDNNRYVNPPFRLVTNNQNSDTSNLSSPVATVDRSNPVILEKLNAERIQRDTNSLKATQEVLKKLNDGHDLVEQKNWVRIPGFQRFSDPSEEAAPDFTNEQLAMVKANNYPDNDIKDIRDAISVGGTSQPVMILDTKFDQDSCKFDPEKLVVYDCSYGTVAANKECIKEKRPFEYVAVASHSGTPSPNPSRQESIKTPAAKPTSVSPAGTPDQPLNQKCGPEMVPVVETNPGTEDFINPRHGTHLAGIIAAKWDHYGAAGINPWAKIVGVEVDLDNLATDDGYGKILLKNIRKIMSNEGVHIVDLSLGYQIPSEAANPKNSGDHNDWLFQLIRGYEKSALFVVASGNKQDAYCETFPACMVDRSENIVTVVGMSGDGLKPLKDSNKNPKFTLGADGDMIVAPVPLNKFAALSGSSQSAAIVAGAASLAMSYGPGASWSPLIARNRLIVCSNITDGSQLKAMMGGNLDISCLHHSDVDHFILDSQVTVANRPVFGAALQMVGGGDSQEFEFFNNTTSGTQKVNLSLVLGFQRIAGNKDDMIIFIASSSSPHTAQVTPIRGMVPAQKIRVKLIDDSLTVIETDKIIKYVRRLD